MGRAAAAASASDHWWGHRVAGRPWNGSPQPRWVPLYAPQQPIHSPSNRSPNQRKFESRLIAIIERVRCGLLPHRFTTAVVSYDRDAVTRHKIDAPRSTVDHHYDRQH